MKKILIAVGLLFVALVACSVAGGSGNEGTVTDKATSSDSADRKADGNTVGNWKILNKPKFSNEFGTFGIAKLKVKNVSDSSDEPWLEIRLTRGNTLVATFDCAGRTVRPGEVTTLECASMDDYGKWTDVEIKNAI